MRCFVATSLAVACVALAAVPRPAAACSLFRNEPLVVGGDPDDRVAPAAPVAGPVGVAWYAADGTCEDRASIELALSASDDRTPSDALGYELTLRSGTLPLDLTLPAAPVRHGAYGSLLFYFAYREPAVAFEVEVRAVDRNGNRSDPTVVAIAGERPDDGGCAAGRPRPSALGPVLIALPLVVARRRRR